MARLALPRAGDPDQAAEAFRLAPALGVPPRTAELALEREPTRTRQAAIDVDHLARNSPVVAEFLAGDRAPMLWDDIPSLSKIEPALWPVAQRSQPSFLDGLSQSGSAGLLDISENTAHLAAAYGLLSPEEAADLAVRSASQSAALIDAQPESLQEARVRLSPTFEAMNTAWTQWWNTTQRHLDNRPPPPARQPPPPPTPPELEGLDLRTTFVPGPRITPLTSDPTFIDRIVDGDFTSPTSLSRLMRAFQATQDTTLAIAAEPGGLEFVANESVRSFASNSPGFALGFVGGVVGGPPGGLAGMTTGGVFTDVGAGIRERLDRMGVDRTNAAALAAAYADPELMESIRAEAVRKGVTTGVVGALFDTLAGGRVSRSLAGGGSATTRTLRGAGALGVELVEQGVGEATSEAAGQLAADGSISASDVFLEAVLSTPTSTATVVGGAALRRGAKAVSDAAAARISADAVTDVADAVAESKTSTRAPEIARTIVDEVMARSAGVESVPIPVGAFEEHSRATGRSPASFSEDITGSPTTYDDARTTGSIELSVGQLALMDEADRAALIPHAAISPDGVSVVAAQAEVEALQSEFAALSGDDLVTERAQLESELATIEEQLAREQPQGDELFQPVGDPLNPSPPIPPGGELQEDIEALGEAAGLAPDDTAAAVDAVQQIAQTQRANELTARSEEIRARLTEIEAAAPIPTADVLAGERERLAGEFRAAGLSANEANLVSVLPTEVFGTLAERSDIPVEDILAAAPLSIGARQTEASTLEQGDSRGGIRVPGPGGPIGQASRAFDITLWKDADISTPIHELGHLFLEVMGSVTSTEGVPGALAADFDAGLREIGVPGETPEQRRAAWDARFVENDDDTSTITPEGRAWHEAWAEGFERYLLDGKAPSPKLRSLFALFRSWMLRVYRTIRGLDVEVSPELRTVFDRLIASDEDIAQAEQDASARALFGTAQEAGMTPEEFTAYRAKIDESTQRATNELDGRMLAAITEETRRARAKRLKELRKEVRAEQHRNPAVIARHWLSRGKAPDGGPLPDGLVPTKIARDSLEEGSAITKRLNQMRVTSVESGIPAQFIAEQLGYKTEAEFLEDLVAVGNEKDLINAIAQTRLAAEQPDLAADPVRRQQAAARAVEEQRSRTIREELRRLRDRVASQQTAQGAEQASIAIAEQARAASFGNVPTQNELRAQARRFLQGRPMRAIRPGAYLRNARSEARRAAHATLDDRHADAGVALRKELLNHELFAEARAMHERSDRAVATLERMATPAALKRVGKANPAHRQVLEHVLAAMNLRRSETGKAIDRAAALREWAEQRREEGFDIDVPLDVLERAQQAHFSELPLAQLESVADFVRIIDHQATLKNRLLTKRDEREFGKLRDAAVATIKASKPRRAEVNEIGGRSTKREAFEHTLAGLRKLGSFARQMDQDKDGGVMWELTAHTLNLPAARESEMLASAVERKAELAKMFTTAELVAMDQQKPLDGLNPHLNDPEQAPRTISHAGRLAVALNWGNESNRQRVLNTYTEAEVAAIFRSLTKRDLEFVNSVWEHLESFWPDIAAQHERIYGIAPERVERSSFGVRTADGIVEMTGGYYPIRYDDERADSQSEADRYREMQRGAQSRAQTRDGHTKRRDEWVGRELRYDLGVFDEHVRDVIHDITHREAVMDVNRVLNDSQVATAIREHYGRKPLQAMKNIVRDVVTSGRQEAVWGESLARHLRHGTTISVLGFRATTAMMQFTGIFPAMTRVSPKMIALGARRVFSNSVRGMERADEFILSRSGVMKNRDAALSLAIREMQQDARFQRGQLEVLREAGVRAATGGKVGTNDLVSWSWLFIQKAQQAVDRTVWMGAYEQALARGEEDARAAAIADQTVIDTQTSSEQKDLARIQSHNEWFKLFTLFYSYSNGVWNLSAETIAEFKQGRRSFGQLLSDMAVIHFVPTVMTTLMYAGLRALDGEADEPDELAERVLSDQFTYVVGGVPIAREVVDAAQGYYQGPAGTRGLGELGKLVSQLRQGDLDEGLLRAGNRAAGTWLHYPADSLEKFLRGFNALLEGKSSSPTSLITGGPR